MIYNSGTGEGDDFYDGMQTVDTTQTTRSIDSVGFQKNGAAFTGWKLYFNKFYEDGSFVNDYLNYASTMVDQNTAFKGDGTETLIIPADYDVILVAQWNDDADPQPEPFNIDVTIQKELSQPLPDTGLFF